MEPLTATLAASVITILTPYVKKTAQAFIESAGEAAYEKAKGLFEALKTRWVGKPAAANLDEFRQDPEGSQEILLAVLKKQLDSDPGLQADLQKRVEEIGPFIDVIQKMDRAEGVTGVDAEEIASGRVGVQQEMGEAKDVTGVRVGRIGGQRPSGLS